MRIPRPSRRDRRFWIKLIAALALAAGAIFDWSKPPAEQVSARLYERSVVIPYRWLVRPFMSVFVHCRFRPTCSQYSVEAVRAYGFPVGLGMTTKRLFRCMPWVPLGTPDPLPLPPAHATAPEDEHARHESMRAVQVESWLT